MEILKIATDWAKAEVFSTSFFILFGFGFLIASFGFWQLGKTDLAKAYIIPTLVAGALLLILGFGLFFTNISRISSFETDYKKDASAFVQSEIDRADKTLKQYTVVFKAVPIIIAVCSLVIILFSTPNWLASLITALAILIVVLLIDGTANARIQVYKNQLELVEIQE